MAFSEQAGLWGWWANQYHFHSGLLSADTPPVTGQAPTVAEKEGGQPRLRLPLENRLFAAKNRIHKQFQTKPQI